MCTKCSNLERRPSKTPDAQEALHVVQWKKLCTNLPQGTTAVILQSIPGSYLKLSMFTKKVWSSLAELVFMLQLQNRRQLDFDG